MSEDYYQILGVSRDSTEDEIKKAYRKQALKWHPDRNNDPSAKVQFQKIAEAFETLGDPAKRQEYDAPSLQYYSSESDDGINLFDQMFNSTFFFSHDDDLFSDHFYYPKRARRPPPQRKKTTVRQVRVTLEDLYTGTNKNFKVTRKVFDKKTGKLIKEDKKIHLRILPGYKHDTTIVFHNHADEWAPGKGGDLVFRIEELPHPVYQRDGRHLHTVVELSLLEALTGFKKELMRLDGKTNCLIEHSPHHGLIKPIKDGDEHIIVGEGMPDREYGKGNLIVHFKVNSFSETLNEEQCKLLKEALANVNNCK
ncbi:hypothetical protein G6F37_007753 [Rhizopus arrhizus]|nr:hypothetical protein G6F38_001800 [Rhizopus arrhizus]KAG1156280.1 hypothetical protein G6F37_007753 [Rhizopus arrhizus]